MNKQQEDNFGSRPRKRRRRGKEEPADPDVKDHITEDSRENEIMGKRDRSPRKRNDPLSKSRPRSREARKIRAERRKRKKKDRKERNRGSGGKEQSRNNRRQDVARRTSKRKRKTHDGLSERILEKLAGSNTSEPTIENSSNVAPDHAWLTETTDATTSSSLQRRPTLETTGRLIRTTSRHGVYAADTVEREFSKQLEMEISKSALKDPSILDDGIFDTTPKKSIGRNAEPGQFKEKSADDAVASSEGKIDFRSSHYDAERMLGYSRTEEDLPILDLENEVLERTLKDYNAYMTSRLKPLSLPRYDEPPIHRTSDSHPPRKPIINSEENAEETGDGNAEVEGATQDDSGTKGDLSCINGTFLPAPLSRHALIKYVK